MIKKEKNERRSCYRLAVEIDVWLYKNDMLFAKARLGDISRDGMFIRTDVLLLPLNSQLDIALEIDEGNARQRVSFPATVIHRCLEGVDVKIEATANWEMQNILSMLAQVFEKSYRESEGDFAA